MPVPVPVCDDGPGTPEESVSGAYLPRRSLLRSPLTPQRRSWQRSGLMLTHGLVTEIGGELLAGIEMRVGGVAASAGE